MKNKKINERENVKRMKLSSWRFGIAGGILFAIIVVFSTIGGMNELFPIFNLLLIDMYGALGYSISWIGVLVGAGYGFIDGFISAWILAFLYNRIG